VARCAPGSAHAEGALGREPGRGSRVDRRHGPLARPGAGSTL